MPFALYFDFETTAPTDNYFDPEQTKMFVVSYELIVCFHPKLKIPQIIVERSYAHSINELTSIDYLTIDQINFADQKLVSQLRDVGLEVNARQCKNALAQMFTTETAFAKNRLIEWFNKKFKFQNLETDILIKNQYERNNPIDWKNDKCVVCKMPLKIDPTNHETPNNAMTDGDFFIRFEHKFLRNIYSYNELAQSEHICSIENYYTLYKKFINICIGILSIFGTNCNIDDNTNDDLKEFLREKSPDINDDIDKLKSNIELMEIKNYVKFKISTFNLKLYALVYNSLIDFPRSKFNYDPPGMRRRSDVSFRSHIG